MQTKLKNYKSIKSIVRLASVACVALAIYGCSSTEENSDKEQTMTPKQQQQFMLEKIESWSAAEPEIQRVLALEADMQLIINQLAGMAELDDSPLRREKETIAHDSNKKRTEQSESTALTNAYINDVKTDNNTGENNRKESKKTDSNGIFSPDNMTNKTAVVSKSSGHYFPKVGIHIAMFKNINTIPLGWQYLQSILPAPLGNKKPLLAKINYQETEYYSLRIGPFNTVNSAKAICINLQLQQHYCSLVEYKGMSFN